METARYAGAFRVVLRFFLCVECLYPLGYTFAKCKVRRAEFKISERAIAEEELAQSKGHQPWRSDAKSVASVGLVQVDPALKVSFVDGLPMKEILKSEKRYVLLYTNRSAKKTYQVTVRRFNWRDPRTRNQYLTVWWLTEIIVRDCSRKPNVQ